MQKSPIKVVQIQTIHNLPYASIYATKNSTPLYKQMIQLFLSSWGLICKYLNTPMLNAEYYITKETEEKSKCWLCSS